MKKLQLHIIIWCVFMISCKPKELEVKDYFTYVSSEESGLSELKELGVYKFSIQYKPKTYIALQELGPENISIAEVERIKNELGGMQYYNFKIASDRGDVLESLSMGDQNRYNDAVNYFSFNLKQDLKLIEGNDTLSCAMAHYARNYGITPNIEVALAFPEATQLGDKKVLYKDHFLGVGNVQIVIAKEDIERIPELKITE